VEHKFNPSDQGSWSHHLIFNPMDFKEIKEDVEVTHDTHKGKYKVLGLVEGSKTLVEVEDIYRGDGWDEETRKYVGVHFNNTDPESGRVLSGGWYLGRNMGFGDVLTYHRKNLITV
jgi:hypothetical protein